MNTFSPAEAIRTAIITTVLCGLALAVVMG